MHSLQSAGDELKFNFSLIDFKFNFSLIDYNTRMHLVFDCIVLIAGVIPPVSKVGHGHTDSRCRVEAGVH